MDYVKRCVNTRFELASPTLQDKWLCEQFQAWTQIITARILSNTAFKQALLDSCGSPLCDPDDPHLSECDDVSTKSVYYTERTELASMDRPSHTLNTWTGEMLIGPEAEESVH